MRSAMVRLVPALILAFAAAVSGACASNGRARPAPFPTPGVHPAPSGNRTPTGSAIADLALSFRGTPYRTGGATPAGFDCSGLVEYVFARNGFAIPRTVAEQYRVGRNVRRGDLEPGDLVFFQTVSRDASHVGIWLGGDEFVHAPSGSGEVRVEHLSANYWSKRYLGARRIGEVHSTSPLHQFTTCHAARYAPWRVRRRVLDVVNCRMCRSSSV
jgi:cell wall-associated NlpC family hydrolase